MEHYSLEPGTKKMLKDMDIYHMEEVYLTNM